MITYMNKLRERQANKEMGAADMVAALVLTPIIIMMILASIDISLWLNTKSHIEASMRDGVRMASMWGGSGNNKSVRLNPSSKNIDTMILEKFYNSKTKTCTRSNCISTPTVKCRVGSLSGNKVRATRAGETVNCQMTYTYKSISPGAKVLGLSGITEKTMKYTVTGVTETGYK